jgi:hypothetical protein
MIYLVLHEGVLSSFSTKILDLLGRKLFSLFVKQLAMFMLCSKHAYFMTFVIKHRTRIGAKMVWRLSSMAMKIYRVEFIVLYSIFVH